jgi:hypothetical protein
MFAAPGIRIVAFTIHHALFVPCSGRILNAPVCKSITIGNGVSVSHGGDHQRRGRLRE